MSSVGTPLSVVITCYNLERFIGQAIQSVLAQRGAEFEIIVVDDCSTDGSAEVIRAHPEVTYVRTDENSGVLLAMMAGVEAASHDIVCLLDGDDLWHENKLAATAAAFADNPAVALVTHDLSFVDGEGRPLDLNSRPRQVLGALERSQAGEHARQGIIELRDYIWLGSALSFRRSVGRFDEFTDFMRGVPDPRDCYQDWPLAYWIAAIPGARFAYIDQPLLQYRVHGSNHSGDARTVARAVRNNARTRHTHAAMEKMADRWSLPPSQRQLVKRKLALAAAQESLYRGERTRALRALLRSAPIVRRDGMLTKEIVRFALGAMLGPRLLTRLAARRYQQGM